MFAELEIINHGVAEQKSPFGANMEDLKLVKE